MSGEEEEEEEEEAIHAVVPSRRCAHLHRAVPRPRRAGDRGARLPRTVAGGTARHGSVANNIDAGRRHVGRARPLGRGHVPWRHGRAQAADLVLGSLLRADRGGGGGAEPRSAAAAAGARCHGLGQRRRERRDAPSPCASRSTAGCARSGDGGAARSSTGAAVAVGAAVPARMDRLRQGENLWHSTGSMDGWMNMFRVATHLDRGYAGGRRRAP